METNEEDSKMNNNNKNKGGFITLPFIIANESFEKVASYGLIPNMIIYLITNYKMSVAKAQNVLFLWNAALNFLPIFGAFLADSYLGRFLTIALSSFVSLSGMVVLWMTTVIPQAKPPPCDPLAANNCQSPTAGQYALLILAFILMSIGAGGVRPCSQAFGADQVDQRDSPKNKKVLETFFNWYYACECLSVVVALTVIVYIQDHFGWRVGFGIPVILMCLSALSFLVASPWYVTMKVKTSLFSTLARVVIAAFKNRKTSLSGSNVRYYRRNDSIASSAPSKALRFLNKACIIQDPDENAEPNGPPKSLHRHCTVEDVEGLKSLLRVLPIWSSAIMMSVTTSVGSFPVLLAKTMDRHLGSSNFEIPAASFGTFLVIVIVIWIPIYDRVLLPLASKIRKKPTRFSVKLRMGMGLFFSFMSMLAAGIVENLRRHKAIVEGLENTPIEVVHMSAMWTIPQHIFGGLAEAFNGIGQTEFYYSELPKNMSSIATALSSLNMAFGSLLASLILNVVNGVTRKGGKDGWIGDNVNEGHYDYYYWLLAMLSLLNIFYYVYCSWVYGPVAERGNEAVQVRKEVKEEELAMLRNTSSHEKGELK